MRPIKWRRSSGGCVHSHCGRFEIWPRFCQTKRPKFYDIYDNQEGCVFEWRRTQALCKAAAQTQLRKHPLRINSEFL